MTCVVTLCSRAGGYNSRGEGCRFFRKSARYRNWETSTTFRGPRCLHLSSRRTSKMEAVSGWNTCCHLLNCTCCQLTTETVRCCEGWQKPWRQSCNW